MKQITNINVKSQEEGNCAHPMIVQVRDTTYSGLQ